MNSLYEKLSAEFPEDQILFRVGATTKDKKKGIALAYVDARLVQDRLHEVLGLDGWQCRHEAQDGKVVCHLGLRIGDQLSDEWIWRSNGAGDTAYEGEKGAMSDAFKRAAVMFGVGRYLYDFPNVWVPIEPANRSYRIKKGYNVWADIKKYRNPQRPIKITPHINPDETINEIVNYANKRIEKGDERWKETVYTDYKHEFKILGEKNPEKAEELMNILSSLG